jgi:hypothetical protein
MMDGLIRNSDAVILQLQKENKVWPGSAIICIVRHDDGGLYPYTCVYLIDGSVLSFDGEFGNDLWRQARS